MAGAPLSVTYCNVTGRNSKNAPGSSPSRLEQMVLDVLWARGPATAEAVRAALAVLRDPRSCAGAILDLAFAMQGKRLRSMEATAMARSTKVGRRVERILAATQFSAASLGRGLAALIAACAIPLVCAAAALTPVPQVQSGEQTSPPVRMYTKADLTDDAVRQLESALTQDPADRTARMKLLHHYQRTCDHDAARRHAWWLIEN